MKRNMLSVFILFVALFGAISVRAVEPARVTAYYFHGTFRCSSCHRIEQYTKGALDEYFGADLRSGKLIYKVINLEEEGNEHFARDYELYTKSVVLSLVENGKEIKYKNLDKVWQYLGDKRKFYDYIDAETRSFLKELKGKEKDAI